MSKRKKVRTKDKGKKLLKFGLSDEDKEELKIRKLVDLIFKIINQLEL